MRKGIFYVLASITLLVSCSTLNTKMTGSWQNAEMLQQNEYSSVFIDVMGPNLETKNMLEDELAYIANNRGLEAVKSQDFLKTKFSDQETSSKEELLKTIRETGSETIFTVALKDKETTTRYVPGTTNYYSPMGYGYYGSYYPYYSNFYGSYDPGYYKEDKVFYVESNLYDVETEELIWSAQSKTYNPNGSEDFVRDYTKALIDKMIKDGVMKEESE